MLISEKQKTTLTPNTKSERIPTKQTANRIQSNQNIDLLKKMFFKTKNRSEYVPNEESLLFDRNGSLAMLKAYRNRKKIILDDTVVKGKQFEISKFDKIKKPDKQDSQLKINLNVQSTTYAFYKVDKTQQLYDQLINKIETQSKNETTKLPNIPLIKIGKPNRAIKSSSQNPSFHERTLPVLNSAQADFLKFRLSQQASLTIDQNKLPQSQKSSIYRIKHIKESNKTNNNQSSVLLLKDFFRQSLQNPQISSKAKINSTEVNYGTFSQYKLKKQVEQLESNSILPELKVVKSVRSLASEDHSLHKGYMHFHPEAKNFLKEHRQTINEAPKIKDFLISGISAPNYAVIDLQTMIPIAVKNFTKKIQIASISKIMTCYLGLLACKKYGINPKTYTHRMTLEASEMNGTSADLQIGDCLTLEQLFYALMLPSGNDAAVAMAEAIGKIIQRHKKKETKKTYYQTFIAHMNMLSRELKLEQEWKNSHGLPLHPNHSTPQAICQLTVAAMMNEKFRQIVSCKEYEVTIKNQRTGLKKTLKWKNTNKLLYQGWEGVKTGTTESAGHCLMAKKGRYLIAVFDSKTLSKRFTQCIQLYDLVKSKERYLFPEKWD